MSNITTEIIKKGEDKFLQVTMDQDVFFLPFKFLGGKWVGFLDISGQHALIERSADMLVEALEAAGAEFDTILNPVSKSNALAHAIAVRWSKKHPELTHTVVARKSSEGASKIQTSYRSVTTNHDQILSLTDDDAEYIKGKKVLMVDDVFGGGGTTKALRELIDRAEATVSCHAVIGVEQGANFPKDLFYLYELPVMD